MSNKNTHIIAFVGMPGAGKSSAVDYLAKPGLPKVYAGGVVYDDMRKHGIEITPDSQRVFREDMRTQHGDDYFIKKCIEQINNLINAGQKKVILDGLYSWPEYKYLKREFPGEVTVVAIVASRHTRHKRLANRTERAFTAKQATERDWTEIEGLQKGGPIAIADHYIINEGSLDELHTKLDDLTQETHFCKAPMQC